MAAHVSISLGVTGVIALLDGLGLIARVNNFIYAFRNALVSQNNETRVMLVSETNPVELFKVFITLICFSVLNIGAFCHHHLLLRLHLRALSFYRRPGGCPNLQQNNRSDYKPVKCFTTLYPACTWTLLLGKLFLLFHKTCMAADHVSANVLYSLYWRPQYYRTCVVCL